MDQARRLLMSNLARHAGHARQRLALPVEAVSRLTGLPIAQVVAVEHGGDEVVLGLDDLTSLALFLGLTVRGIPRSKVPGSG